MKLFIPAALVALGGGIAALEARAGSTSQEPSAPKARERSRDIERELEAAQREIEAAMRAAEAAHAHAVQQADRSHADALRQAEQSVRSAQHQAEQAYHAAQRQAEQAMAQAERVRAQALRQAEQAVRQGRRASEQAARQAEVALRSAVVARRAPQAHEAHAVAGLRADLARVARQARPEAGALRDLEARVAELERRLGIEPTRARAPRQDQDRGCPACGESDCSDCSEHDECDECEAGAGCCGELEGEVAVFAHGFPGLEALAELQELEGFDAEDFDAEDFDAEDFEELEEFDMGGLELELEALEELRECAPAPGACEAPQPCQPPEPPQAPDAPEDDDFKIDLEAFDEDWEETPPAAPAVSALVPTVVSLPLARVPFLYPAGAPSLAAKTRRPALGELSDIVTGMRDEVRALRETLRSLREEVRRAERPDFDGQL